MLLDVLAVLPDIFSEAVTLWLERQRVIFPEGGTARETAFTHRGNHETRRKVLWSALFWFGLIFSRNGTGQLSSSSASDALRPKHPSEKKQQRTELFFCSTLACVGG